MKIEKHNRRIKVPREFADSYYLLAFQGDSSITLWGFSDWKTATRASRSQFGEARDIKTVEDISEPVDMEDRLATISIEYEEVKNAAREKMISLPEILMKEAGLKVGDEVEIYGNRNAFFLRKK